MGRRSRRRGQAPMPDAPEVPYPTADGGELVLRAAMTLPTRQAYAELAPRAAGTVEDLWQRRAEFLFERLAVRWTVAGVDWEGQKELLQRFRVASQDERHAVRDALRAHLADFFPDVEAP
ncbi:MAG TPA: hypothetical protein VD931_19620 [Baekduia sp.]|nr:hypothetical protein [Baekduia sp.]